MARRQRCRRRALVSATYSRSLMSSTGLQATITPEEMLRATRHDRPDLVEEWDEAGTTPAHMERLAANAQWLWDRNLVASAAGRLAVPSSYVRIYSISQAIWLATEDDLYEENTFDRHPDDEPLTETQLRSGWFSIS